MATSSARKFSLAAFAALLALLVSAVPGYAACDPTTDPDKSDIANARAAVHANCLCQSTPGSPHVHGAYVSCAAQQANAVLVNKSCAGFVTKCAAHSICGRGGFVTCCRTTATGRTMCAIKSRATKCAAPPGGSACVGQFASCCDACTSSGCAPPPPLPSCSGPAGSACGSCAGGGTCFVAGTSLPHKGPGAVCVARNGPCAATNCSLDTECPAGDACIGEQGACCATCPSSPSGAFLDDSSVF